MFKLKDKNSFTIIELILVIIVISIIITVGMSKFSLNRTISGTNNFIINFQYFKKLGLNLNEYNNTDKQWFKHNLHLKFTNYNNNIYYYIFNDSNNDNKLSDKNELLLRNNIYLCGASKEDTNNDNYPEQTKIDKNLNLTQNFGITKIEVYYQNNLIKTIPNEDFDILINNYGQIYLNEGNNEDNQIENKNFIISPLKLKFYGNDNKIKTLIIGTFGNINYE